MLMIHPVLPQRGLQPFTQCPETRERGILRGVKDYWIQDAKFQAVLHGRRMTGKLGGSEVLLYSEGTIPNIL